MFHRRLPAAAGLLVLGLGLAGPAAARDSFIIVQSTTSTENSGLFGALLPAAAGHLRLGAMLAYLPRFLWKSVLAGFDIARRALDPRLPLNPGFVTCPTKLPPGRARNEFASITSLMPGSVPADDGPGMIVFHCLDIAQPVAEQMAAEERTLARVLVAGERHA